MLLRLQRYEFEVSYKKGTSFLMAVPLSRAYLTPKEATEDQEDVMTVSDTRSPTVELCLPLEVQDYFPFKEELTLQNGVIIIGDRVVIPFQMRAELKRKLHSSHLGVQACLRRARKAFYWPGIYKEIEEHVSKCQVCNSYHQGQQREPMISHTIPSRRWQVLAVDLFELQGQDYLVTTDYYSNFFEVDKLVSETSKEVFEKSKPRMARHGIPDKLVSDNGPQFSSQEFKTFKDLYEFDHVTSSPTYPQSNGKAENAVKTAQRIMLKASEAGTDPYLGFLDFPNTPTEGLGTSPAQRLFGRRTKTLLLTSGRLLTQPEFDTTSQLLQAQKNKQAFYYNNGTKELRPLEPGNTVRINPPKYKQQWTQATVEKQVGVRSYQVTIDDGRVYRMNRRHLRLTAELPKQLPPDMKIPSSEPGPLPSTKVEQVPPVVESKPQEVGRPQATPNPQDADETSPERRSARGRVIRRPAHLSDYTC
ncbi:uncharacterized protein K02A2.6-like [Stylophora pistillata]|nr:uncharacterized protein K02A2.6-like [Stylophora pistillata]